MIAALGACMLLFAAAPAAATTYTVSNGNDDGAGSLRQAIADAENNANEPTVDVINFSYTGDINLDTPLQITLPVTIDGPGADSLRVRRSPSATGSFGLFFINPADANYNLTIRDLTISGARATNGVGGAIGKSGLGTLILDSVVLSDNKISGNGSGGAIYYDQGHTSILNSTLTDNEADFGGAIVGTENSLIGGNAELVNSTVAGNRAPSYGGGIYVNGLGEIQILSSTIQGNVADSDDAGVGDGGGISTGDDDGISMANTLLAGNVVGSGTPVAEQCNTHVDSFGYNLRETADSGAGCGGFSAAGDAVSASAGMLGPLTDNGGSTPSIALLGGNPAIDAGSPAALDVGFPACPAADQRGLARGGSNGRCDIGAFETQVAPTSAPTPVSPVVNTGGRKAAIKKCKKKFPKGKKRKKCIKRAKKRFPA